MVFFSSKPLGRGMQKCTSVRPHVPASMNQEVLCTMYAIIATGGKQYRVSQGDVIYIEKIDQDVDSAVSFDVLMIGGEDAVKIGNPVVEGAKVEGKVLGQVKGEKVLIYKYKSKKNYHRRAGHRQPYTKVEITAINA
jgi:large subunit ribosomal protein L21